MEFEIRKADAGDLEDIMEIMEETRESMEKPEWFAADTRENVERILKGAGIGILAREKQSLEAAGLFLLDFPKSRDNMGTYLGLTGEELDKVVYMDSAAVKPAFRGMGLQRRMLKAAEALLDAYGEQARYRMCTIHPDNRFSLWNMGKNGYQVIARDFLYGGLERLILYRDAYEI